MESGDSMIAKEKRKHEQEKEARRRGGKSGKKKREGWDKGEIHEVREREKGRGVCVCVYDGNSCFKKKKRSGLFGGREEHLRFLFGQLDMQLVCCSAHVLFFLFFPPLFAILPAKTTYTYFENWSLRTSCSHLSHLKSAREDQSVL